MVRQRPAVVADLLSGPMRVDVPKFEKAMLLSGDMNDLAPTEYRADGVVALYADEESPKPALAVIFEAQRRPERQKKLSWPGYVATAHARHDCPTTLLVWCETKAVARWAAEPISTGDPGLRLTPVALGPDQIPVVTDPDDIRRHLELAVLSLHAHGLTGDPEPLLGAFVETLDQVDPPLARMYAHLVASALTKAAQNILEKMMTAVEISASEWAKVVLPDTYARLTAEGKAEGKAESVLTILDARSIAVPAGVRERISTCTDPEQLDTWLVRAATALKVDDLFD